jgi:hypothetical protein
MTKFIFNDDEVEQDQIQELVDNLKRNGFEVEVRHGWVVEIGDEMNAIDLKNILELIDDTIGLDFVDHINVNR